MPIHIISIYVYLYSVNISPNAEDKRVDGNPAPLSGGPGSEPDYADQLCLEHFLRSSKQILTPYLKDRPRPFIPTASIIIHFQSPSH